jgi:hypothetical protein
VIVAFGITSSASKAEDRPRKTCENQLLTREGSIFAMPRKIQYSAQRRSESCKDGIESRSAGVFQPQSNKTAMQLRLP